MEKSCRTCKYSRTPAVSEPCVSCCYQASENGVGHEYEKGTLTQICGCGECQSLSKCPERCLGCITLTGPDRVPTRFIPDDERMRELEKMLENVTDDEPAIEKPATDAPKDAVNHPGHYTFGSIEVIDYIRDKLTPEEFQGYCEGNVLKYVSRWRHKGGVEDLKKAKVYLQWMIESAEKQEIDAIEVNAVDDAVRMLEEAEECK